MNFFWLSVLLILASSVHCQELCRYNLEAIEAALNSSGNVEDFIVDCLALNGSYARYISLSVVSDDSADSVRYDFQCVAGGTLIPTISNSFSNTSTPGVNPFCSSCNFAADDPCIESEYIIMCFLWYVKILKYTCLHALTRGSHFQNLELHCLMGAVHW